MESCQQESCSTSRLDHQTRYDAIDTELRCLSDFHRMRQRGGFEEDEAGTIHKTAGRTRILKLHHLEDFLDEDYENVFGRTQQQQQQQQQQQHKDSKSVRNFRIFNQFARSVCRIKAIPRKEIFEAWAMALYVHETFLSNRAMMIQTNLDVLPVKRFADLVCSHGLLSWALLLLSSAEEQEEQMTAQPPTTTKTPTSEKRFVTAVCVDIAMPPSSEKAAGIFFHDYPQLGGGGGGGSTSSESNHTPQYEPTQTSRWDYVEGPVENLVPHETTLLVGIHACGKLSDTIIAQAISANAPLALVPCCHSKKILTLDQTQNFKLYMADHCVPISSGVASHSMADTLADFTDGLRTQRLLDAGYDVRQVFIPKEFSLKNRVLLAIPPSSPTTEAPKARAALWNSKNPKRNWGIEYFPIPLEDSPKARATVRSIAGRAPSVERFHKAHPPPALGVNFWLSSESTSSTSTITDGDELQTTRTIFTVEALQNVMDRLRSESETRDHLPGPLIKVEDATKKLYHNPEDGRLSKTFRIHYLECRNNKEKAKKLHKTLKEVTIPTYFPTVTVR